MSARAEKDAPEIRPNRRQSRHQRDRPARRSQHANLALRWDRRPRAAPDYVGMLVPVSRMSSLRSPIACVWTRKERAASFTWSPFVLVYSPWSAISVTVSVIHRIGAENSSGQGTSIAWQTTIGRAAGSVVTAIGHTPELSGQLVTMAGHCEGNGGHWVIVPGHTVAELGQAVGSGGHWVTVAGHCVDVAGQTLSTGGQ